MPGSREFWRKIAAGQVGEVWKKWVPWYNVHKTFAGLRDAYLVAGSKARDLLIGLGDWAVNVTANLSDDQMQQMLGSEYGGMNEAMADIYAITKDEKYLTLARRFNHRAVLDPLMHKEDRLTGLHANTQIPKVIGLERIATLTGDKNADTGARFFWETVTGHRSVAFGGNSVSEHFNNPKDFRGMLEHREGPETCNTYNMLRLTEQLFAGVPKPITPIITSVRFTITFWLPLTRNIPAMCISRPYGPVIIAFIRSRIRFLVLRRHRHGKSRTIRPVHLCQSQRRFLRQPFHRLGTFRPRQRLHAATGNCFSR